MPPTWNSLISILSKITRENHPSAIQCTHCGNHSSFIKWGSYRRYLFDDELINIQRYRCDNDQCPRTTFSVLPHAFLPIARASVCMLMYVLMMNEQGQCIAQIAKKTGSTWPRIQRWISKARLLREWLKKEYGKACPCYLQTSHWYAFARDFSWAFYPARFRSWATNIK